MNRTRKSQRELVRAWLQMGYSLTALEALEMFGIMRLASRISDLKRLGVPIRRELITVAGGARVARYSLLRVDDSAMGRERGRG